MTKAQAQIGTRVRSLRDFCLIPKGTEGVVDQAYQIGKEAGIMVAWDMPDRPLPTGYREYDGRPLIKSGILRDGFNLEDELQYLEVVGAQHDAASFFAINLAGCDFSTYGNVMYFHNPTPETIKDRNQPARAEITERLLNLFRAKDTETQLRISDGGLLYVYVPISKQEQLEKRIEELKQLLADNRIEFQT